MTRAEARAWKRRWRLVAAAHRDELRTTPMETKFRQLASMMQTAIQLGWSSATDAEIEATRALWVRLKEQHEARVLGRGATAPSPQIAEPAAGRG